MLDSESLSLALDSPGLQQYLHSETVIRGAFSVSSYLEGTGTNLACPVIRHIHQHRSGARTTTTQAPHLISPRLELRAGSRPTAIGCRSDYVRLDPVVQPAVGEQWNLSIQNQVTKTLTAQVGYVGQKVTHLVVPLDLGQLQLGTDNTPFIGGFNGVDAGGNSLGYGPNSFADVYDTASVGTMRYDALQAVLQKRVQWRTGRPARLHVG